MTIITLMFVFTIACFVAADENAKEVEGGVELLKTGPIQLIVPDVLSFTLKTGGRCAGAFTICYVSKTKGSREQLKSREYWNVGNNCPPDMCALIIEPIGGIMGLAVERHDGNVYGLFDDTNTLACPREVVDELFNFTVVDLPECPVIVDGAQLPKDEVKKPKNDNFVKWVIVICVVLALLILIIVVIGMFFCMRHKRKSIPRANSVKHSHQLSKTQKPPPFRLTSHNHKISERNRPNLGFPSPTTPTIENEASCGQSKPPRKLAKQHLDISDSDTSNKCR